MQSENIKIEWDSANIRNAARIIDESGMAINSRVTTALEEAIAILGEAYNTSGFETFKSKLLELKADIAESALSAATTSAAISDTADLADKADGVGA